MKILYTLFLSLLVSTVLHAQYDDDNNISKENAHKTIHLPNGVHDGSLPMDISGIQIINAVGDSSLLGYVQTGMFNRWAEAIPNTDLTPFLQAYVTRRYGFYHKAGAPQLIFVIQDLRINERTSSMSEKAYLHFKGMAFSGNEKFQFVTELDTFFERGGMDVTHKHGDNIVSALHLLLKKTANFSPAGPQYSLSEVQEKGNERYQKPAFTAAQHQDGIYLTFEEFLNDQPTIKDPDSKQSTPFWGLRKNGLIFKSYNGALVPLEMKQRSIALTDYIPAARRKNNYMLLGAVGGGLIASSIIDQTYQLPMVKNSQTIGRKPPLATTVDVETGDFTL
jgi:hypothetical protein